MKDWIEQFYRDLKFEIVPFHAVAAICMMPNTMHNTLSIM